MASLNEEYKSLFSFLLNKSEYEVLVKFIEEMGLQRSFQKYISSIPKDKTNDTAYEHLTVYSIEVDVRKKSVKGIEIIYIDPYIETDFYFLQEAFSFQIQFAFYYIWKEQMNFNNLAGNDPFSMEDSMEKIDKISFEFTEEDLDDILAVQPEVESIHVCLGFTVGNYMLNIPYPDNLEDYSKEELNILNDYAYELLENWMIRLIKPVIPELPSIEKIMLSGLSDLVVQQLFNFPDFIQKHQTLKYLELSSIVPLDFEKITQYNLKNLEVLVLNTCHFASITETLFQKLTSLKKLEFTENALGGSTLNELPLGMLYNLYNLEYLDISGNHLMTIPEGFFRDNKKLRELVFERNKMNEEDLVVHLNGLPVFEKYDLKD